MIRIAAVLILLAAILPAAACSTIKTGKNIAIDNPLQESRTMQSLSEARQEVEKSRRALDKCMAASSGDESRCQSQKAQYDKDVEAYVSLQGN